MSQLTINIGSEANDHTGDSPRIAFGKVNDNFTELFARRVETVPATATDSGTAGQYAVGTGWLYICVATNTWQRVAIATWT